MCNKSYAKYRLYARSLKKEGERWYFIVEKKGNCTRGFPRIFLRIHVWGREYLRSWRSPSLPHSEIKSYTILDISRIGFATLSLKANDYHSAYLWNSGESVHARVYTCSKFVPFETNAKEKWYEKWSNYATYCKDPYSSPPCAPTHVCPRHWKSFLSIDGKNCFDYETTGFSFLFFLSSSPVWRWRYIALILA